MLTVAGRIVVDRARARATRPQEVGELRSLDLIERDHADRFVDSMEMFEALQELSQEQRDAIVQMYFRGCNFAEAAQTLGVPEGTVKSRVHYGMRALRNIFPGLKDSGDRGGAMTEHHDANLVGYAIGLLDAPAARATEAHIRRLPSLPAGSRATARS